MEISLKSQYKNATNVIQITLGKKKSTILPEVNSKVRESKQLPLVCFLLHPMGYFNFGLCHDASGYRCHKPRNGLPCKQLGLNRAGLSDIFWALALSLSSCFLSARRTEEFWESLALTHTGSNIRFYPQNEASLGSSSSGVWEHLPQLHQGFSHCCYSGAPCPGSLTQQKTSRDRDLSLLVVKPLESTGATFSGGWHWYPVCHPCSTNVPTRSASNFRLKPLVVSPASVCLG